MVFIYFVSNFFFYNILNVKRTYFNYSKDFLVISHYVVNNYPFDEKDKRIIEEIMPFNKIKERYNCLTVNPLFWGHPYLHYDKYIKYRDEIRRILFKLFFSDFSTFFESILCSSSYIYYLNQSFNIYRYHSNDYIEWDLEKAKLFINPKLPQIQKIIEKITDLIFNYFKILTTAAIYFYLVIFLFFKLKNYRLILIPTILNTIIFIFISVSNDWRFLAGNYFISVLIALKFITYEKNNKSSN